MNKMKHGNKIEKYFDTKYIDSPYIDLSEKDRNKNIYRIISLQQLINILDYYDPKFTLVNPIRWNDFDPYENEILKQLESTQIDNDFDYQFRDCMYASCWSLIPESYALWKIYSPNNDHVKICTTIQKLIDSLYNNKYESILSRGFSFIGKIKYCNLKMLEREYLMFKYIWNNKDYKNGGILARTLLLKRNIFKYEDEIRLIHYNCVGPAKDPRKAEVNYPIDPINIIEEIMFDPKMDNDLVNQYKEKFIELGYPEEKICQSSIYSKTSFD